MSKRSVLIIEDEILIQKSLALLFSKNNCVVETSSLGKDAIEKIQNNDFDLIVTDLMLNDITGFDIIESSLNKYDRKEISNIFTIISAYSSNQILEKVKKYECDFFPKPFDNIQETVSKILKKRV